MNTMSQSLYKKPNGDIYLQLFNELHKIADQATLTRLFGSNPTISEDVPLYPDGFEIGPLSCLIRLESGLVGFCVDLGDTVEKCQRFPVHGFNSIAAVDYYQFSHEWFPKHSDDQLPVTVLGTALTWGKAIEAS